MNYQADVAAMQQNDNQSVEAFDAVVVGAGFAGLYMLHRLLELGLTVQVLEAASDVGGVWNWNRYPGARCDVESMQYSYSFSEELQQEWNWTERFATQPEILRYINHVVDRFDLRRHIMLDARVVSADYDAETRRWTIGTEGGRRFSARYCLMATGCLSAAKVPDIPKLEDYRGRVLHTSSWPQEGVDLTGQRVALIGTGSSGVQATPLIAEEAGDLVVFQRTANFSVPAGNEPLTPEYIKSWKDNYAELRQEARYRPSGTIHDQGAKSAMEVSPGEHVLEYEMRWKKGGTGFTRTFNDLSRIKAANDTAAEFIRSKIRSIVKDPETREALIPGDFPVGAKRLCCDTGYFEAFNRDNVHLVDLKTNPIVQFTERGIQTKKGEYEFDVVVFATGFDALTGALLRMNITGRDGATLQEKWAAGPHTYLGLMSAGFPNLFMITGPGSPSVLGNVIVALEQHVEWVGNCIEDMEKKGRQTMEADPGAEARWVEHANEVARGTLYYQAGTSWYLGANVPGKPRVFMPYAGGFGNYRKKCDEVAANGYEGFVFDAEGTLAGPTPEALEEPELVRGRA